MQSSFRLHCRSPRFNSRPRSQAVGDGAFRATDGSIDRCEQVRTGLLHRHGTERHQSNPDIADRFRHTVHSAGARDSHDYATDPTAEPAEGEAQSALNVAAECLGQSGVLNTKFQLHEATVYLRRYGYQELKKRI